MSINTPIAASMIASRSAPYPKYASTEIPSSPAPDARDSYLSGTSPETTIAAKRDAPTGHLSPKYHQAAPTIASSHAMTPSRRPNA